MDKSIFNFKLVYEDGRELDLSHTPFWVSYFRIEGTASNEVTERIEGCHGLKRINSVMAERQIRVGLQVFGYDRYDFDLLRDEANQLFPPLKQFYIVRDLQPGKQAKVSRSNSFNFETYHDWVDGEFEIILNMHQPLFESRGTTLNPFTFEEKWQVGMNITTTRDLVYRHSTTNFQLYNAGDIEINPRWFPLKIMFRGASRNLKIVNQTNNTSWQYLNNTVLNDRIIIDGVKSFKNNVSIFKDTTHTLLSLNAGWNDISIIGNVGAFSCDFEFKYYYY